MQGVRLLAKPALILGALVLMSDLSCESVDCKKQIMRAPNSYQKDEMTI